MAYYLTIKNSKNEYKKLDISSLEKFQKKSKFKEPGAYSLEEIDKFTSKYYSEFELKRELLLNGVISLEDFTKDIEVRIKKANNLDKVRYGLAYKKDTKYLNYMELRYILLSKQNDRKFLEKLVAHYRNTYVNRVPIARVTSMLHNNYFYKVDEVLNEFFEREIQKLDPNTGELILYYKPLRDLAMFISNYELNEEKEKLNVSEKDYNTSRKLLLKKLKESLTVPKEETPKKKEVLKEETVMPMIDSSKVRTRKKKNIQVEGQISFFD